MRRHNELVVSMFVALALSVCACDHVNAIPTGPSAIAPRIDEVSPLSLVQSDRPQTLAIRADGFTPDSALTLVAPNGASTTFSGPLVQKLAEGYEISATLAQAGAYMLRASNGASVSSTPFTLDVQARTKPWIGSVTPIALAAAASPQVVTVSGTGFAPGIIVTLVNGYDGTVIGDDAIANICPTSFTLRFAFAAAGSYAINLVTAAGDPSNTVTVVVR